MTAWVAVVLIVAGLVFLITLFLFARKMRVWIQEHPLGTFAVFFLLLTGTGALVGTWRIYDSTNTYLFGTPYDARLINVQKQTSGSSLRGGQTTFVWTIEVEHNDGVRTLTERFPFPPNSNPTADLHPKIRILMMDDEAGTFVIEGKALELLSTLILFTTIIAIFFCLTAFLTWKLFFRRKDQLPTKSLERT